MSNRYEDLNPFFEPVARLIVAEAQARISEGFAGSIIRPAVTFRTVIAQAQARAAGKSDLSLGMHNFGLAIDVAVIGPNGDYIIDGQDRRYTLFGQVATEHGCIWGGTWVNRASGKPPDYDHCEARISGTVLQYVAWLDSHRLGNA